MSIKVKFEGTGGKHKVNVRGETTNESRKPQSEGLSDILISISEVKAFNGI